jgi:hypothetical protein
MKVEFEDGAVFLNSEHGTGRTIRSIWALIADHGNGDEGIPAFLDKATGVWMPFITSDESLIPEFREQALRLARKGRNRVRLVRFETRTDEEEFDRRDSTRATRG